MFKMYKNKHIINIINIVDVIMPLSLANACKSFSPLIVKIK